MSRKTINRRTFLKKSFGATAGVIALGSLPPLAMQTLLSSCSSTPKFENFYPATATQYPMLEVQGSYYQIGHSIGRHFADSFHRVLTARRDYIDRLKEYALNEGKDTYDFMKASAEDAFPHYVSELKGMAEGSGVDLEDLWAFNLKAEIDSMFDGADVENPGCSTIHYIGEENQYLLHNEDGHDSSHGEMFLVKVRVPGGRTFICLSYPLILAGNGPGFNNAGIVQTVNFISSRKIKEGIPRYFISRAILEADDLSFASRFATLKERAYPYHHNFVDFNSKRQLSLEVTPWDYQIAEQKGIYLHTNHLILPELKTFPQDTDYVHDSSMNRYRILKNEIDQYEKSKTDLAEPDYEVFLKMLSAHEGAPYSPCRHPKDDVMGRTLGTAVFDIQNKFMDLYMGNPCTARPEKRVQRFTMEDLDLAFQD